MFIHLEKTMKTVTLAHYYTTPEIQIWQIKLVDSLELSLYARDCNADIIVFAGVKFMAETTRLLILKQKLSYQIIYRLVP